MPFLTLGKLDTVSRQFSDRLSQRKKYAEAQIRMAQLDAEFDLFLSHSYADSQIDGNRLSALKLLLEKHEYSVYTDWEIDPQLDRTKIDSSTSKTLRTRMDNSRALIFVTSQNSSHSLWMPWELGYMDGAKDRACILPVLQQGNTSFKGQEYLGIYPWVTYSASRNTGEARFWVHETTNKYTSLDNWLDGQEPYEHD